MYILIMIILAHIIYLNISLYSIWTGSKRTEKKR